MISTNQLPVVIAKVAILASEPFLWTRFVKLGHNSAAGHGETVQDVCLLLQEHSGRSSRLTCIPIQPREPSINQIDETAGTQLVETPGQASSWRSVAT